MTRPILVNLGCGSTFHPDWLNLDVVSNSPLVKTVDLKKGIPLPAEMCEAVYHSHILEHFSGAEANTFIADCYRVLAPGGILRVVVPDLEGIARNYLITLEAVLAGKDPFGYDLAVAELYDQTVRSETGGTLGQLMRISDEAHRAIVLGRFGSEAEQLWNKETPISNPSLTTRLIRKSRKIHFLCLLMLVRLLGGKGLANSFAEGVFRDSGEIHRWMYDQFSLGRLLGNHGFVNIKVCTSEQSRIPQFSRYELDFKNGIVRKPDSMFMEGQKEIRC